MSLPRLATALRASLRWLVVIALVAVVVYRVRFAPPSVVATEVRRGTIVAETLGTGTLEARVKTILSARLQERLAEVLVDQNDSVRAGQLLARLDEGELRRQVEVAEAAERAAQASLERVRADEARARAVEQQATLNHQRVVELIATKVASQDTLDKAVEALAVAVADVKRAVAAIREAEFQLITAEKSLAYQGERLAFTRIVSPYDGLVTRRDRDPGGIVVPGSSILQLISTNELWISAWVDETLMARLAPGQPARVVFRSEPGTAYPGAVARLGRETDRETRECLVDVRVQRLPANWSVGQRAEVFIETGRKTGVLVVPSRMIQWRESKPGVFVSDGGVARWRDVALGLRGLESVEVVQGLEVGDLVITPQEPRPVVLVDGQRLRVLPAGDTAGRRGG